jgi:hypothetical protein
MSLAIWIFLGLFCGAAVMVFCWGLCAAAARGDSMGDWRTDEWPFDDDPPDPL